jgi:hypothetical protein
MARYEHLPIYKAAIDLAVYVEQIAAGFSRYHKYTLGSELRALAHRIVLLIVKANNVVDKKPLLQELLDAQEEMKIIIRLSKEVKAFHSFNSFETCIRHLDGVLKQSSGWLRSQI